MLNYLRLGINIHISTNSSALHVTALLLSLYDELKVIMHLSNLRVDCRTTSGVVINFYILNIPIFLSFTEQKLIKF